MGFVDAFNKSTFGINVGANLGSLLNQNYSSSTNKSGGTSSASAVNRTNGTAATMASTAQAAAANNSAAQAWKEAAAYNAQQAQIQREWQEKMANTVYQRTVEDMKKAGINPILAATMGMGTGAVGSGATASMTSANTYMGNAYADSYGNSASNSSEYGYGSSQSEGGALTAIKGYIAGFQELVDGITSALALEQIGETRAGASAIKAPKVTKK